MNPASELLKNLCRLIFVITVFIVLCFGWSYVPWGILLTALGLVMICGGLLACALQPGLALGLLLVSMLGTFPLMVGLHILGCDFVFEWLGALNGHVCAWVGVCIGVLLSLFIAAHKKG